MGSDTRLQGGKARWRMAVLLILCCVFVAFGMRLLIGGESDSTAVAAGRTASGPATRNTTKYDRIFGPNIFYKVPPGYRGVQQKAGVVMIRQSDIDAGSIKGILLITQGLPLDAAIQEKMRENGKPAVVQAIALAMSDLAKDPDAKLSSAQLVNDPDKDGYEVYLLSSESYDKDAGQRRFIQYAIFLTRDRIELAMRIGYGTQANLEALADGFGALLLAMEFRNAGAPPPTRLAAALPADMNAIMAKATAPAQSGEKTDTGAAGAGVTCSIEQQQGIYFIPYSYGTFGGGGGTQTYTYPQRICRMNGKIVKP